MTQNIYIAGEGYVSTGSADNEPVTMNFKDGPRLVPMALVDHLGGPRALLMNVNKFKDVTFQEFHDAFWKLVTKDTLNRAMSNVIENHLAFYGLP